MRVSAIQLINFRNYEQLSLMLNPGVSLFIGENGHGKTNLVEAIRYASTLSSHRVAGYQALVSNFSETANIGITVVNGTRSIDLGFEISKTIQNRMTLNNSPVKKQSEILGVLQTVIFSPEDLDIVKRDPSNRRNFINEVMISLRPSLSALLGDYERVLKQRNALLKSARNIKNPDLSTLDIWDEQLISSGSRLISERLRLVSLIEPLLESNYAAISNQLGKTEISLISSLTTDVESENPDQLPAADLAQIENLFRVKLLELRRQELERGLTLAGPHRDDLLISLHGMSSRHYASQGEAWSIALALKLTASDLIKQDSVTGDPVLIMDDVFSVLDAGRRDRLTNLVSTNEQVLITAAVADDVPAFQGITNYRVADGVIANE